jgi:PilZ domain-containing protein
MSTIATGARLRPLNRRRAERVPMPPGGPVAVVGARLVLLSPFGMLIESPVPIVEEAVLPFRLAIAGLDTDVTSRVAACQPLGERRFGVGLEFVDLDPALREGLRDLLARYR